MSKKKDEQVAIRLTRAQKGRQGAKKRSLPADDYRIERK